MIQPMIISWLDLVLIFHIVSRDSAWVFLASPPAPNLSRPTTQTSNARFLQSLRGAGNRAHCENRGQGQPSAPLPRHDVRPHRGQSVPNAAKTRLRRHPWLVDDGREITGGNELVKMRRGYQETDWKHLPAQGLLHDIEEDAANNPW